MIRRLIAAAMLSAMITACGGGDNTGTKVGEMPAADEPVADAPVVEETVAEEPTEAPVAPSTFAVGDVVAVGDSGLTIALESIARLPSGEIAAVFVADNSAGTEDESFSSMLSFELRDDNGNKAAQTIVFEGAPAPSGFDGTAAAGDKLRGYIAWNGEGLSGPLRVTYQHSLMDTATVTWEVGEL